MHALFHLLVVTAILCAANTALAVKRVPYPEIRLKPVAHFAGDAGLDRMRKQLAEAIVRRDLDALTKFVGNDFTWTSAGDASADFDARRDAIHNFKVAFGFRPHGASADGPTEIGPQWALLALLVGDPELTREPGSPLVCGPVTTDVADPLAFQDALERLDEEGELSEWVFAAAEVPVMSKPEGGQTVGRIAGTTMPIVAVHPLPPQGDTTGQPPTHFEVLLPSGKSGWVQVRSVRPLFVDQLCYSRSADGEWKIVHYDQAE